MNIFVRELRANFKSLVIWIAIITLLIVIAISKFAAFAGDPKIVSMLDSLPPAMLDALPDVAVPDVVFCYRDPASGASKLIRMNSIPDVPELLVQGPLGHLMTSGALERFVKTHKGPDARKQQAKAWLESLKAAKPSVGE